MKTSGSKQIAQRYVKALFDVSESARAKVEKDLKALRDILAGSKDLRGMLSNPLLTRKQQAQAMGAVLAAIKAQPVTRQFVELLAKQKRLEILPAAIELFMEKTAHERGEMKATAVSAAKLSTKDVDFISGALSKIFGKKVALETSENPELLGGVVVKIGSLQLDASLSGKLRRLGNKLRAA